MINDNSPNLPGCGSRAGKGSPSKRLKTRHRAVEGNISLKDFVRKDGTDDARRWMEYKGMK